MNRLAEMRKRAGLTRDELAEKVGTTATTIYRKETGMRGLKTEELATYAKALGCSVSDLVDESAGAAEPSGRGWRGEREVMGYPLVPVVGYVGAGAEMHPFDDHAKGQGIAEVEFPGGPLKPGKTVAVQVVGDSMTPFYSEGDQLFYDERIHGVPEEWLGKICVVKVVDGPTLVKRVSKASGVGLYRLSCIRADEPDRVEMVEWSAKVKMTVHR